MTYEDVFFRMGRAGSRADPTVEPGRDPDGLPSGGVPFPNRGESFRGGNCAARPSREPVRECLPFEEPPLIVSCVSTVDTGIGVGTRRLLARDAAGAETSESDPEASLFVSNSSARRAASFAAASAATSCGVRIRGGAPFRAHGSAGSAKSFTIRSSTGLSRGSPSRSATERGPSGERLGEWPGVCHGVDPRLAAGVCPGLPILALRLFSSSHASQVSNPPEASPYAPTELWPSSLLGASGKFWFRRCRERSGEEEEETRGGGSSPARGFSRAPRPAKGPSGRPPAVAAARARARTSRSHPGETSETSVRVSAIHPPAYLASSESGAAAVEDGAPWEAASRRVRREPPNDEPPNGEPSPESSVSSFSLIRASREGNSSREELLEMEELDATSRPVAGRPPSAEGSSEASSDSASDDEDSADNAAACSSMNSTTCSARVS